MDGLIKFTEVFEERATQNRDSKKRFALRSVYINPSYVVTLRENDRYKKLLLHSELIEGLDERQQFTSITLAGADRSSHSLTVVGALDIIFEKLYGRPRLA